MLISSQYFIKVKIITVMNYTLKPFSSSIFVPNRSIKIKNYKDFKFFFPLSLKLSIKAKALALLM